MENDLIDHKLRRLVLGLADQSIRKGTAFMYQHRRLLATEISDIMLPSIVCIAQDLSDRLGMNTWGYEFHLGGRLVEQDGRRDFFQLHWLRDESHPIEFFQIAPFITEVFEGEFMDCRNDVAVCFEHAAKLIDPTFSLAKNTDHEIANSEAALEFNPEAVTDEKLDFLERLLRSVSGAQGVAQL
jgi:hypothetical protein